MNSKSTWRGVLHLTWRIMAVWLGLLLSQQQVQAQAICPLACNDLVHVSMDTNCIAVITPDMVLEDPGIGCPYEVRVYDSNGDTIPGDTITAEYVGQTLQYAVYIDGNSCWGHLKIEDKFPPVVQCPPPDTVWCHQFPGPDRYRWPTDSAAFDACGPVTMHVVNTEWVDYPCDSAGISGVWRRWVYWTDASGNVSDTCMMEVYLRRATCADITFPPDTIFSCVDYRLNPTLTDPRSAGMPMLNGTPLPTQTPKPQYYACELWMDYTDDTVDICPGSFKILRHWKCIDDCTPTGPDNPLEHLQIIKVIDVGLAVSAPGTCPEPFGDTCRGDLDCVERYTDLIGMNYWNCLSKKFYIPDPFTDPRFTVQACSEVELFKVGVKVARDPESCIGETYPERFDLSHYDSVKGKWYVENLPPGYSWIIYHFRDQCNNYVTARYDVYVYDDVPPNPVCDEHTVVSLNYDGKAKLYASSIDDGSTDNCGVDTMLIRRMRDNCRIRGNTRFGEFVEFCCQDLTRNPHMVVLKVVDERGNMNTCMVEVTVQDKLPPTVVCPPDVTVPCDYDLSDLDVFGTIVKAGSPRNPVPAANDPRVQWSVPLEDRIDGEYYDNDMCNVSFEVRVSEREYDCKRNIGWVRRTFIVRDGSGNTASCTQVITIRETQRFQLDDEIWGLVPDTTIDDGCASDYDLDPSEDAPWGTLTPELVAGNARGCYSLAINYEDKIFTLGSDACLKIIRQWTVIDWCQVVRDNLNCGAPGVWCHTQIIKIIDNEPPAFTCDDIEFTPLDDYACKQDNFTATRKIRLKASANDNCASDNLQWEYWIERKVNGNICRPGPHNGAGTWEPYGRFAHGTGDSVVGYFDFGEYRIHWKVKDQCGNVSECKYFYFDVLDRKLPTPSCRDEVRTVIMPSSKTVSIWANEFNLKSFDNCPENTDVRFRLFHPATGRWSDARTGEFVLDCDFIGKQVFWMYVIDQCNNQIYCEVTLDLQDPDIVCGNSLIAVGGKIYDVKGNMLKDVDVVLTNNISGTRKVIQPDPTTGYYSFRNIQKGYDYTLQPEYDKEHLRGVTTLDLVLIQNHILGRRLLSDPVQFIAADATNDGKVTVGDIQIIRHLVLGKIRRFTMNDQKSWRFVPESFQFDDPRNPFPFADKLVLQKLQTNVPNANFMGIKIGDVSGDAYEPNGTRGQEVAFLVDNVRYEEGQVVKVPIRIQLDKIIAGQFTVKFDPSILRFDEIEEGEVVLSNDNFNFAELEQGMFTTSWMHLEGLEEGDVIFTIVFTALRDGDLREAFAINSAMTPAEVYDAQLQTYRARMQFKEQVDESGFALLQNRPNPFSHYTTIGFVLPEAGWIKLTVFDISGKVLHVVEGYYDKGYNEVEIDERELRGSGIMYYQLEAGKYTATRKMILLR